VKKRAAAGLALALTSCLSSQNVLYNIPKTHPLYANTPVCVERAKSTNYGTAFTIDGGRTYVTAKHVVKGAGAIYLCKGLSVDDIADQPLELLKVHDDADVATLIDRSKLSVSSTPVARTAEVGDTVYVSGWNHAFFQSLEICNVVSRRQDSRTNPFGEGYWVSCNATPGMSGGPAYIVRGGELALLGTVAGILDNGAKTFVLSGTHLEDLLK
jgi:S1-C subfamily serine protease